MLKYKILYSKFTLKNDKKLKGKLMRNPKYLFLCILFISNLCANDISNILSKVIETYGGEENLRKLSSYKQTWKINAIAQNEEGVDSREVILPHTLKTTLSYNSKTETRVLTPDEKYKIFNGKKEDVTGLKAKAMTLQLKRLYTPLILKEKISELKLEDYGSHFALVLKGEDDKVVYFVDKKNFVITQVTGLIYIENNTMTFKTLYTIFRKFNGILIPTKEYKYANDIPTAILTLEKIDF